MTRNDSFMARFGARLVDNGYPVLPIQPGTKRPGRYTRGAWRDYRAWVRHCERPTTVNEVEVWSQWPDAGVGIAGGAIAAVDIDVLDAEAALAIEQFARQRLGDTRAIRIGLQPKRLLVYRAREPFPGIKATPIEILTRGQQFVAYAIHPVTGQPYAWPEESLAEVPVAALPAIAEEDARAFLVEAAALVPQHLRPTRITTTASGGARVHAIGERCGTREGVMAALHFIPNADLPYEDWVRLGMALKGALGEVGLDLFLAWSAQSAKDVPEATTRAWASFRPTSIGAGTIYHLAIERGWKPQPDLVLNHSPPKDDPHPAAPLLARLARAAPMPPGENDPGPFDMGDPGGVLGQMVRYMVETARRPQPVLSLGASLCALGALMGRNYRTESNLRSNLYVAALADSGSGKNHSREVINELLLAAGLGRFLGGNKIASGAGLLTAVSRQPSILFQIDEFGMFLEAATDRRRSPRHIVEILENLLELFSAAGGVFLGAEYANRDGANERRDINEPCVCVYGTTTPLRFWNALQSANVADGSLARFIILQTNDDYPDENLSAGIRRAPPELVNALKLVATGGGRERHGNLAGLTVDPATAIDPMTVVADEAAKARLRAISCDITTRLKAARGTPFTSLLARIVENATKVALVRAVSRDPAAPVITAEDVDWALAVVRHFGDRTMIEVERHVADNEVERHHKRVLAAIRAAGTNGITKSDLIRRTQFLDKRRRDEVMAALVEAGLVETFVNATATKPSIRYRFIAGAPLAAE